MQTPYSHPPSNYQAPTSHSPATNRIPHSQPGPRPDHTGTKPAGDTTFRDHRVDANVQRTQEPTGNITQEYIQETNNVAANYHTEDQPRNQQDYNQREAHVIAEQDYIKQEVTPIKKFSKQNSRESIGREDKTLRKQLSRDVIPPQQNMETDDTGHTESNVRSEEYDTNIDREEIVENVQEGDTNEMEKVEYNTENKPIEEEQYDNQQYSAEEYQNYDPNYEQPQANYEQPEQDYVQPEQHYEQPEQNYEQLPQNYVQPEQHYEQPGQHYEQPEQNYEQPQQNYEQSEQNYEQPEQTYEQPQYTEQYENYEQYPQQYVDPNAQFEGQYENYPTDGNYTEQAYDNTQYDPEYTEQQYSENVPEQVIESTDDVKSTDNVKPTHNVKPTEKPQNLRKDSTPKEKVASQS